MNRGVIGEVLVQMISSNIIRDKESASFLYDKYIDKFSKNELMHIVLGLIYNYDVEFSEREKLLKDLLKYCKKQRE